MEPQGPAPGATQTILRKAGLQGGVAGEAAARSMLCRPAGCLGGGKGEPYLRLADKNNLHWAASPLLTRVLCNLSGSGQLCPTKYKRSLVKATGMTLAPGPQSDPTSRVRTRAGGPSKVQRTSLALQAPGAHSSSRWRTEQALDTPSSPSPKGSAAHSWSKDPYGPPCLGQQQQKGHLHPDCCST